MFAARRINNPIINAAGTMHPDLPDWTSWTSNNTVPVGADEGQVLQQGLEHHSDSAHWCTEPCIIHTSIVPMPMPMPMPMEMPTCSRKLVLSMRLSRASVPPPAPGSLPALRVPSSLWLTDACIETMNKGMQHATPQPQAVQSARANEPAGTASDSCTWASHTAHWFRHACAVFLPEGACPMPLQSRCRALMWTGTVKGRPLDLAATAVKAATALPPAANGPSQPAEKTRTDTRMERWLPEEMKHTARFVLRSTVQLMQDRPVGKRPALSYPYLPSGLDARQQGTESVARQSRRRWPAYWKSALRTPCWVRGRG